ncbi:nuclear transport factor 2 family protein [Kitasatospora sp. NPDC101801]|uniref:nuclear transport factor 2 family protein n=1 Tax=Kitasatospora sp. NPDC101801 TaxID=3364103 RepID=UPI00380E6BCA
MNARRAAAALLTVAALATACGSTGRTAAGPAPVASASATAGTTAAGTGTEPTATGTPARPQDLTVIRAFTDAANRGDLARVSSSYAPDAHFDRAGAQFAGRDRIVNSFLRPDVLEDGGHYREISVTAAGDRTVVEYVFTARGGAVTEHFTYAYLIRDGVITHVIGRYV